MIQPRSSCAAGERQAEVRLILGSTVLDLTTAECQALSQLCHALQDAGGWYESHGDGMRVLSSIAYWVGPP